MVVLAVGGAVATFFGVVWGGATLAQLAAGHRPAIPASAVGYAIGRLPANLSDPATAWGSAYSDSLPGPVVYWLCTAITALVVGVTATVLVKWLGRSKVGTSKRRPLGVDARPRFAKARDLAPLLVRAPQPGRFIVARFGRRLVATEATPTAGERREAAPR